MQVLGTGKTEELTKVHGHNNTIPLKYTWIWCGDYECQRFGGPYRLHFRAKFLDHKGNWESALNNRIANLSPSCVPQYNVQRFPSTCGTPHISIQESALVLLWSEGQVKRSKKGSGLLCQHLEVKMRFKILECTTCYLHPHDLKGQAAAWAGLHTWTYYLHNLPSNKREPLSWKQMVLRNHMN